MAAQNNLLVRLHQWAHRQDENFVTESFAFLLQHLIEEEPNAAAGILTHLTGGFYRLTREEIRLVTVRTQFGTDEGIPDLAIRLHDRLALVEVKVEAQPTAQQLDKYLHYLAQSSYRETCLVLLTRYNIDSVLGMRDNIVYRRWYQIADWFAEQQAQYTLHAVSGFLINQFLDFLGERGMTMGQVTWEFSGGIRALRNFMMMLEESALLTGVNAKANATPHYCGIFLDDKKYWTGIYFDNPDILCFETYNLSVDPDAVAKLDVGEIFDRDGVDGHGWERKLDLTAENVHFFARPRSRQMELLETFIRENLAIARSVELPTGTTTHEAETTD